MSDINIQVDILVEALLKKKRLLEEILDYSKEQEKILNQEELDLRSFNNIMKNKQVRIDNLMKIDDGFEGIFDRIKTVLTSQPDLYREAIKKMQVLITEINDLGIDIKVKEMRNKQKFDMKSQNMKGEVKLFRAHKSAMTGYQNNYIKQQKADAPHFFDSKK